MLQLLSRSLSYWLSEKVYYSRSLSAWWHCTHTRAYFQLFLKRYVRKILLQLVFDFCPSSNSACTPRPAWPVAVLSLSDAVCRFVTAPISWPVGKLLDLVLGIHALWTFAVLCLRVLKVMREVLIFYFNEPNCKRSLTFMRQARADRWKWIK